MSERKHWLDFIAIFIAVLALATSIWSGYATRRHNRLSVKPNIGISTEFAGTEKQNGIYLNVNGPGPALIKEFKIFIGDTDVKLTSIREALHIIHTMLNLEDVGLKLSIPNPSVYQPGEKFLIIGPIKLPNELTLDQKGRIASNFQRLKIYVKFESLYEEVFEHEKRDFEVMFD